MRTREQFLEQRKSGIGGSDAAAALGLSKWTTPLELYREKRGESAGQEENEPMRWGTLLEPVIRQQYVERTGRDVMVTGEMLRHPKHDWMLANLDGVAGERLVEIKTARSPKEWGEPGTDQVPYAYLIQVQHYLTVTALPVADIAVLFGGSDFQLYEVPADRELQEMIVDGEAEFWKMVQAGTPPEPRSYADAQSTFGKFSRAAVVQANEAVAAACAKLSEIKLQMKVLEANEELEKGVIQLALGECDTLAQGQLVLATWKLSKGSTKFDVEAFKAAHPDLYSQFLKLGAGSRRFLLK